MKSSILNAFSGIIGKMILTILCVVFVMVEEQKAKFKVASYYLRSIQAVGSWYAGSGGLFVPVITNDKEIVQIAKGVSVPLNVMAIPGLSKAPFLKL